MYSQGVSGSFSAIERRSGRGKRDARSRWYLRHKRKPFSLDRGHLRLPWTTWALCFSQPQGSNLWLVLSFVSTLPPTARRRTAYHSSRVCGAATGNLLPNTAVAIREIASRANLHSRFRFGRSRSCMGFCSGLHGPSETMKVRRQVHSQ